jgi:hypothetical protein
MYIFHNIYFCSLHFSNKIIIIINIFLFFLPSDKEIYFFHSSEA